MQEPFLGVLQHTETMKSPVSLRFLWHFQPFLRNLSQPNAHTLHESLIYEKLPEHWGCLLRADAGSEIRWMTSELTGPENIQHTQKGQLWSQREEDIMQTGEILLLLWVKPQKAMWSFSFLPLPLILPTHILCNPSMTVTKHDRKHLNIKGGLSERNPCKTPGIKKAAGWIAGNSSQQLIKFLWFDLNRCSSFPQLVSDKILCLWISGFLLHAKKEDGQQVGRPTPLFPWSP